jgi:REP element-mobilizing transposase RayT
MYNPKKHHRHSIRLQNYDYANAGLYFVTVCLNQRIPKNWRYNANYDFPTFGKIENEVMTLNDAGKMVQQIWNEMPQHHNYVKPGEFVVMPDHIHGIIEIGGIGGRGAINRAPAAVAADNNCSDQNNENVNRNDDINRHRDAIYRVQPCNAAHYAENEWDKNKDKGKGRGAINRAPAAVATADNNCSDQNNEDVNRNDDINRHRGAIYRVQPCNATHYAENEWDKNIGGFAGLKNPMLHDNLSRVVRWLKGRITFECRKINCDFKWQRNFHERIIRTEIEYLNVMKYIRNNPVWWGKEKKKG